MRPDEGAEPGDTALAYGPCRERPDGFLGKAAPTVVGNHHVAKLHAALVIWRAVEAGLAHDGWAASAAVGRLSEDQHAGKPGDERGVCFGLVRAVAEPSPVLGPPLLRNLSPSRRPAVVQSSASFDRINGGGMGTRSKREAWTTEYGSGMVL